MSKSAVMDPTNLEIQANKERSRALVEELRDLNKKTAQQEGIKKAKANVDETRTYENN
jgi:hypothetical protein